MLSKLKLAASDFSLFFRKNLLSLDLRIIGTRITEEILFFCDMKFNFFQCQIAGFDYVKNVLRQIVAFLENFDC